jgi:hypothetical protein
VYSLLGVDSDSRVVPVASDGVVEGCVEGGVDAGLLVTPEETGLGVTPEGAGVLVTVEEELFTGAGVSCVVCAPELVVEGVVAGVSVLGSA